jgi:hypothetical protein
MVKSALLCVIVIAGMLFSGCNAFQREIRISRAAIQNTVNQKFPVSKNVFIASYTLDSPVVYFADKNIGMKLMYRGNLLNMQISGSVDFNGRLVYRQEEQSFFLTDLQIVEIIVNNGSYSADEALKAVLTNIANTYLEKYPVYQLNQEKQKVAKRLLKDIKVEKEALVLKMGL